MNETRFQQQSPNRKAATRSDVPVSLRSRILVGTCGQEVGRPLASWHLQGDTS